MTGASLLEPAAPKVSIFALTDGSRHKDDVHRIRVKPTGKWESCPSISPEAVAQRQGQKLGSSRPSGDVSFLGCPAPGQRLLTATTGSCRKVQLDGSSVHFPIRLSDFD